MAALGTGRLLVAWGFPLPGSDPPRLQSVDGLRGLLALSVLLHHAYIWSQGEGDVWVEPGSALVNQLGSGAVALFFMITALLFTPRIQAGWARVDWPAFLIGRAFRILPMLACSLLLVAAVILQRPGSAVSARDAAGMLQWIATWDQPDLFGHVESNRVNARVLWSLQLEWIFYLLVLPASAMAMSLLARRRDLSWLVPMGLLLISTVGARMAEHGEDWPWWRFMPFFAAGMLAFECQRRPDIAAWMRRPLVAPLVCALLVAAATQSRTPDGLALIAFFAFFVAVACGNSLGGVLTSPAMRALGEVAFAVYLLHGILLSVVMVDLGARAAMGPELLVAMLPVLTIITILVAAVANLVVERPAIDLGKRLVAMLRRRLVKRASYRLA